MCSGPQINLRRLRATLQPGPTRCLHIITTYLPRLSADKYNSFNGKIRKAMDRLLETPQSVNDFVLHIHFLKVNPFSPLPSTDPTLNAL
jgi:hypothetical protein